MAENDLFELLTLQIAQFSIRYTDNNKKGKWRLTLS